MVKGREAKVYAWVVLFVLAFNFLIVSPVVFEKFGLDGFARIVYLFFKPICHQIDARSFHFDGVKFAVCERCSLIYFGAFVGTLILPFLRRRIVGSNLLLLIAFIPSVVEFSFEKIFGIEILTFKVLVSLWLGVLAGLVLTSQIVDMFSSPKKS